MSAWAHLIASTYARRGLYELAAVWRQHARALEVREQLDVRGAVGHKGSATGLCGSPSRGVTQ